MTPSFSLLFEGVVLGQTKVRQLSPISLKFLLLKYFCHIGNIGSHTMLFDSPTMVDCPRADFFGPIWMILPGASTWLMAHRAPLRSEASAPNRDKLNAVQILVLSKP